MEISINVTIIINTQGAATRTNKVGNKRDFSILYIYYFCFNFHQCLASLFKYVRNITMLSSLTDLAVSIIIYYIKLGRLFCRADADMHNPLCAHTVLVQVW